MKQVEENKELVSSDQETSNGTLAHFKKPSSFASDRRDVLRKFIPLLVAKTLDMLARLLIIARIARADLTDEMAVMVFYQNAES